MQPQYLRQLPAFLNARRTKSTLACIGAFASDKVLTDAGFVGCDADLFLQLYFGMVLLWVIRLGSESFP
jgi:hypothetical protein